MVAITQVLDEFRTFFVASRSKSGQPETRAITFTAHPTFYSTTSRTCTKRGVANFITKSVVCWILPTDTDGGQMVVRNYLTPTSPPGEVGVRGKLPGRQQPCDGIYSAVENIPPQPNLLPGGEGINHRAHPPRTPLTTRHSLPVNNEFARRAGRELPVCPRGFFDRRARGDYRGKWNVSLGCIPRCLRQTECRKSP